MTYKITERVHITREFLVEADYESQAIEKFNHITAKLLDEKENRYYEVTCWETNIPGKMLSRKGK